MFNLEVLIGAAVATQLLVYWFVGCGCVIGTCLIGLWVLPKEVLDG